MAAVRVMHMGVVVAYLCILMGAGVALQHDRLVSFATDIHAADIFTLTNDQRVQAGSPKLAENAQLMTAAANKAADMFAKNYWAHNSPTGVTPWDFITSAGYTYTAAAENLAKNFDTSSQVITAWMNSPEHRTNLLNARYRDVGIAVMNGTLLGEQTTLVVMEFGQPAQQPAPVAPAKVNPTKPAVTPPGTTKLAPSAPPAVHMAPVTAAPRTSVEPRQYAVNPDPFASWAAARATVRAVTWVQWLLLAFSSAIVMVQYVKQGFVWRCNRRVSWHIRMLRAYPMLQVNLAACASALMVGSAVGVMR